MDLDLEAEISKKLLTVETTVDIDESNLTPIQEFYKNANVFITGCTGFLGQVLLEKLLRSCPVGKIYILIRNKKGKDVDTRLEEIFKETVFKRVVTQFPDVQRKVFGVEGDCSLPDLGLSDQNKKLLIDEIDIVFHVAATVRFDEQIKTSILINIRAPNDLLRMARQMPRLKSFMHVSTAYCNCINQVIEEDVYPPAANHVGLINMAETLSNDVLNSITPNVVGKYPNTYVFTKQVAESVIKEEGDGLPVGIHRPAIVVSTYKEPIRGWINNVYGLTGVSFGSGLGLLRILHCDTECNANIIPVDMCVNSLIAAAWDVGNTFKRAREENRNYKISVYTYESCNDNPINWGNVATLAPKYGLLFPSVQCVWFYVFLPYKSYPVYLTMAFLLHTLPALIADTVLVCRGKPRMMAKAYKKIHKFSSVISHFATNQWTLKNENFRRLVEKMSRRDRQIFFSDMKELEWEEYFKCYIVGARWHLVSDPLDTVPEGKKKYRKLYWAHQIVVATLSTLLLWVVWSLLKTIFNFMFG